MSDPLNFFRLDGRVAVVTGAASGIGASVAETLAQAGASVVLGDVDEAGVKLVAERIALSGGVALPQRCDVSRREDLDVLVGRATSELAGIDVMCNVAGVPSDGYLADVDEAELDRVIGINLKGVIFGCQAAVHAMRDCGGGTIVNVSSTVIDAPNPGYGVYGLTKSAVAMLTQTLALEEGPNCIRVNAIAPGATITKFTSRHLYDEDGSLDQAKYDAFIERMKSMSPLGAVGEPLDQALLVLYLVSDASRFCTGQIWRANGGQALA